MKRFVVSTIAFAFLGGLLTVPALADWVPDDGHKMHYPQMPNVSGWDVMATSDPSRDIGVILADDWMCTETGPVTDIHFWGSWKHGNEGIIVGFWLSIHDNIPGPPSMPGTTLWEWYTEDFLIAEPHDPPSSQGWYDPMTGEVYPDDHVPYFLYNIVNIPSPFTQVAGNIYWLNVTAVVVDAANTSWGWKSTLDHWEDDAVWAPWGNLQWTEMYEPMPEPPLEDQFEVFFGPGGQFMGGWGSDPNWPEWFFYPSGWWNVWFYDHPYVRGKKFIHIEFDALGPGANMAEFAVNWSTDAWSEQEPPPDHPPLPGEPEEIFIGREMFPMHEGHNIIDFEIPFYNPEWVSVDIMPGPEPFDIMAGTILHQCIPSLELAFVITGGPPQTGACCWTDGSCTMETQSNCEDNGGTFYPGQNCADVDCTVEDPVYDLWETPAGYNTFVDFGCGPSTPSLPADFFGPGSDLFEGTVALEGEPLATNGNLGPTDAIIKRSRAADLPQCPSQDQVELEIVALNLVSVDPIIVTYDGGQNPEQWDVKVCLSESREQPTGVMNINQVCQEGGTFSAYVPVVPKIIFTRISDGMEYNVDYGEWGLPAIDLNVYDGHWMFSDPGFGVYTSSVGDMVSNCDDVPDIPIGPSAIDLIPGLQAIPCIDCSQPAVDYDIPITSLLEPAGCAQHDVWPPHDVVEDIPTLTEWGMIILGLLLLTAGTIAIVRRRKAAVARTN